VREQRRASLTRLFSQQKSALDNIVNSDKVVMFSATNCGYCDMAKALLQQEKLPVRVIEIDKPQLYKHVDMPGLIKELMERTQSRTIPQIFIR
jgi:glutaredoxin